jgi:hypothetical protein
MRFKRWMRVTPYEDTNRKRAAFRRKMMVEQQAMPLFAAEVAAAQPAEDEVFARRADVWVRSQQRGRDERAQEWRKQRARLAQLGANLRPMVIECWRNCPYPADPVYLAILMTDLDRGKLDPASPP